MEINCDRCRDKEIYGQINVWTDKRKDGEMYRQPNLEIDLNKHRQKANK